MEQLETETPETLPEPVNSGRFCRACGRRLDDSGHDRGKSYIATHPITGRSRVARNWICRLRLIGQRLDGTVFVPSPTTTTRFGRPHVQRLVPENNARYVHESRFQNGELV